MSRFTYEFKNEIISIYIKNKKNNNNTIIIIIWILL